MRVLLLGGTGHLGSALRKRLPRGVQLVFAHHRNPTKDSIFFDLEATETFPRSDLVIGAFPLARSLQNRSADDVERATLQYVHRCGAARLVQLSSDAVFSGRLGLRAETDPTDPVTAYGNAQAVVDRVLSHCAPSALIVRTSFIFGWSEGKYDKRIAPLAADMTTVSQQRWPRNVFRAPTEVNFLAEGIWRTVELGSKGVLNIAGPRCSIAEFFENALSRLGPFDPPPPFFEVEPSVARDTSLRTERMTDKLGLVAEDVWKWYTVHLPEERQRSGMGALI